MFQDPDDQLFMPTVRDDVAFGPANLGYRGDELDHRVDAALRAVGMARHADRAPHHLSFGQRRRVAARTVLSMDPTVLVLDEPSSNLDPVARREFADIVLSLGLTTLIVTHDLLYALQLCPRSVIMNDGRIVADGPTARDPGRRRPAGRQPARAAVRIPRLRNNGTAVSGENDLARPAAASTGPAPRPRPILVLPAALAARK